MDNKLISTEKVELAQDDHDASHEELEPIVTKKTWVVVFVSAITITFATSQVLKTNLTCRRRLWLWAMACPSGQSLSWPTLVLTLLPS